MKVDQEFSHSASVVLHVSLKKHPPVFVAHRKSHILTFASLSDGFLLGSSDIQVRMINTLGKSLKTIYKGRLGIEKDDPLSS
jgi:hypothetical protein